MHILHELKIILVSISATFASIVAESAIKVADHSLLAGHVL